MTSALSLLPMRRGKLLVATVGILGLAGCATFSDDGGFGRVEQTTRERLDKDVQWARSDAERSTLQARVGELLANPLTADDAIQLALYNNRGLQAAFFDLGIGEAELVQAGRLPNPHFSMLRASKPENGIREYKIEQALTFNIFALITMPLAVEVEKRKFAQAQQLAVIDVARLAAEARQAYYTALAAEESVRYLRKVRQAAEAGAELARRMALVGNFSKLRQTREQAFYADAALNLARSEQSAIAARERLARVLGLPDRNAIRLPERLPDLPKTVDELPGVEQAALDQRLDLQAIRLETEALAKNLGLSKATRFINVLEVGRPGCSKAHATAATRKATKSASNCRFSIGVVPRWPRLNRFTCRRWSVPANRQSMPARRFVRPITPTEPITTLPAITVTRWSPSTSGFRTRTCSATTAC